MEPQVQRYSRAILLREVGGTGQEALLATGARLTGTGPMLLTAAAYLAAGGTPVQVAPGVLATEDTGFLVRATDVGQPAVALVSAALEALNPDAARTPVRTGTLAAAPLVAGAARPLVAVGRRGGRWLLWAATEAACGACLGAVLRDAAPPDAGPRATQAGALAAVLFERLVLGLGPALEGLLLEEDGSMQVLAPPFCVHGVEASSQAWAAAVQHLAACYPEEGCGVLLAGPAGDRFVPLANAYDAWAARDPAAFPRTARSAFVFHPPAWLQLLREADARGERVAAIVHSHPDGESAFSAEDRAQAAPGGVPLVPGAVHLVVAVRAGRPVEASCVRWAQGAFQEAALCLPG